MICIQLGIVVTVRTYYSSGRRLECVLTLLKGIIISGWTNYGLVFKYPSLTGKDGQWRAALGCRSYSSRVFVS